jgi:nitroreductase
LWEQQLSCGAACMNLEHAAHAVGYAAGWITGWAAYSRIVRDAFGAEPEQIAGFIYLGTPGMPLEERARPDPGEVVSSW